MTNPTYFQIILPHLDWLRKQRDTVTEKSERRGVNAGIILFSAIFLEGLLEDILCSFIWHYSDVSEVAKSKGLVDIESISSLEGYYRTFESLGVSVHSFLIQKQQEDLATIFSFSNLLAHGQRDSYLVLTEEDWTPKKVVGSFYSDLEKFFVKRKVLSKSQSPQPNMDFRLFSDPVADWIYEATMDLSLVIMKQLQFQLQTQSFIQINHLRRIDELFKARQNSKS